MIYNEGTQEVQAVTDVGYDTDATMQVAGVQRPLLAVYDAVEKGNSVLFSKKYGHLIFNDDANVNVWNQMREENGTYLVDLWFFRGSPILLKWKWRKSPC